jgi:DNA-binding MarR family transcriptional regulator
MELSSWAMPRSKNVSRKLIDHPPEVSIPFLANRAAIAILGYSDQRMAQWGITVPKWRIIYCLGHYGPLIVGDIAERTSIEASTLSRNLVELEASKLLVRTKVPTDTRSYSIALTAAGAKRYREVLPFARKVERLALEGIAEGDVEIMRRALAQIYRNLKEAAPEERAKVTPISAANGRRQPVSA